MRVAIDVSIQEDGRPGGVARAQRSLLRALAALGEPADVLLCSRRPVAFGFDAPAGWRSLAFGRSAGRLWRETALPLRVARERADVLLSPVAALPAACPAPAVATLHDVPHRSDAARAGERVVLRHRLRNEQAARQAARIACVSEWTRSRFLALHPEAGERARVTPNAVDDRFFEAPEAASVRAALDRLGLEPGRFVIAVAPARPRKNLPVLLRALRDVEPLAALLVGRGVTALARSWSPRGRLRAAEALDDASLRAAMAAALAVVVPSWFEGFGLPALEAMALGTPVVASSGGALPETVGDAALLFDPSDSAALAAAVRSLAADESLRRDLARRGRERAERFRGSAVAPRWLDVLREAAETSR